MKPHEGTLGEKLQQNCEGLKVLLVDERSMIGTTTLGWMEFMCRYGIKNGENIDQSWGGLPVVIFLWDDVQLSQYFIHLFITLLASCQQLFTVFLFGNISNILSI